MRKTSRTKGKLVEITSYARKNSEFLSDKAGRSITWDTITAGDCEMKPGSALAFYTDGTGTFDAEVLTHHTHSGDTWHAGFDVEDSQGKVLFRLGDHTEHDCGDDFWCWDGPNHMNDDGTVYSWHEDFTFDSSQYDAMSAVGRRDCC